MLSWSCNRQQARGGQREEQPEILRGFLLPPALEGEGVSTPSQAEGSGQKPTWRGDSIPPSPILSGTATFPPYTWPESELRGLGILGDTYLQRTAS